MRLTIPGDRKMRRPHFEAEVADFAEASRVYCTQRDESGEGGSTFNEGQIFDGATKIARVSYNGRVWAPGGYIEGAKPLWDNR